MIKDIEKTEKKKNKAIIIIVNIIGYVYIDTNFFYTYSNEHLYHSIRAVVAEIIVLGYTK